MLVGDKKVSIEGKGAWKSLFLIDNDSGEVEETKFYKADFGTKILYNPMYHNYMEALYEKALIIKPEDKEHPTYEGVNMDSVEELKAVQGSDILDG